MALGRDEYEVISGGCHIWWIGPKFRGKSRLASCTSTMECNPLAASVYNDIEDIYISI